MRATPRQLEVLSAIRSAIRRDGWAPTRRELMAVFDWHSTNAATDHLLALERKGLLRLGPGSRAIAITPAGDAALGGAP